MDASKQAGRRTSLVGALSLAAAVVIGLGGLAIWGITSRARAMDTLVRETNESSILTVQVTRPKGGAPQESIVLPGTIQADVDAPIYARTSGYLRRRLVDLGDRVKAGQLLAEIDAPELEQQLQQARADLVTAESNVRLAQITADRYLDLRKTDSVSQQDVDNAVGTLEARKAAAESAKHNVQRLEQLQGYTRIYAPFAGVITARNTDVGALIDSGASGGAARELFHIAETAQLRVFTNVPEVYSRAAQPGLTAELTLGQFPGRTFTGTLVRTAKAIDVASRTLLVEFQVSNATGELLPGSFVQVAIRLPVKGAIFRLPVNALLFRSEGLRVAVVQREDTIAMVPVTLGRDFGTEVEIVTGLGGAEQVVINPPESLVDGQTVRIMAAAPAKAPSAGQEAR